MIEYINNYEKNYGPDIGCLKGKITQQKADTIQNDYIKIPRELILQHEQAALFMDMLYINGMAFLATFSKHIQYHTIEWVKTTSADYYRSVLDRVF